MREAAQSAGVALDKDVGVIIDVGADKLFDQVWKLCLYYTLCLCVHEFIRQCINMTLLN